MIRARVLLLTGLIVMSVLILILNGNVSLSAVPKTAQRSSRNLLQVGSPWFETRVHKYGNVRFSVSNWGMLGSMMGSEDDAETGEPAESFEFPSGSDIEYLFYGGLWVGAIVGVDTLVSTGVDGWQFIYELWPCAEPVCAVERRSNIPGDPYYHPDAVSHLDYIAVNTDTLTDSTWVNNDFSGRPHIPLDLDITQRSYSWMTPGIDEFVIVEYSISTISGGTVSDAYVGMYFDADVFHISEFGGGHTDDITGFRETLPSSQGGLDTVNCAWAADNDGDPDLVFDNTSATGVLGVAFLEPRPGSGVEIGYNWWQCNGNPAFDWGPWLAASADSFDFHTGGLGTPEGDRSKYFVLSNGELDYDLIWSGVDQSDQGWLSPGFLGELICYGGDVRCLLSMGPFDIGPDEPLRFAVTFAAGDSFHVNPTDFEDLFDPADPTAFYESLNFSDLAQNLRSARDMFNRIHMGDINWDSVVDIDDAIWLIAYIFSGGPGPLPYESGDVDCSGGVDIDDVVYLIQYIFAGGPPPGDPDGDGEPDC